MGNAQVAYNRGKSVDTLSLFPVQYVSVFFLFFFFSAGKFKAIVCFGAGFEKTSYATSRQLSRSLPLNFFT